MLLYWQLRLEFDVELASKRIMGFIEGVHLSVDLYGWGDFIYHHAFLCCFILLKAALQHALYVGFDVSLKYVCNPKYIEIGL